jgi:hypothetical protein
MRFAQRSAPPQADSKHHSFILVSTHRKATLSSYAGAVGGGFKYTLPVWTGIFLGDTGLGQGAETRERSIAKPKVRRSQAIKPAPSRVFIYRSSL